MKHFFASILIIFFNLTVSAQSEVGKNILYITKSINDLEKEGFEIKRIFINNHYPIIYSIDKEDLVSLYSNDTLFVQEIALTNELVLSYDRTNLNIDKVSIIPENSLPKFTFISSFINFSFKKKGTKVIYVWTHGIPKFDSQFLYDLIKLRIGLDESPYRISTPAVETDNERKKRLDRVFALILYERKR